MLLVIERNPSHAQCFITCVIYVVAYITFMNAVNQTAATFNNAASQYSKMLK